MTTATPEETAMARAMREAEEPQGIPEDATEEKPLVADEDEPIAETFDSQLDDIEIQTANRDWLVEGDINIVQRDGSITTRHFVKTYWQKPLSFTAMLQFTGLIGERLTEAMSGDDGLTIDGVIGESDGLMSAGRNVMSAGDFAGIDSFVKGIAKLAQYVPAVIEDCQCIWLRVPLSERLQVREIWSRSPEDGGLSIEDGEEMLNLFLAQNYKEVEAFFVERLPRMQKKVAKLRSLKNAGLLPSKRSKPTADPTPSQ